MVNIISRKYVTERHYVYIAKRYDEKDSSETIENISWTPKYQSGEYAYTKAWYIYVDRMWKTGKKCGKSKDFHTRINARHGIGKYKKNDFYNSKLHILKNKQYRELKKALKKTYMD